MSEVTRYVLRIYYRGMKGEWNRYGRARIYATRGRGIEAIERLDLSYGWSAQLAERCGDTDIDVVKVRDPLYPHR